MSLDDRPADEPDETYDFEAAQRAASELWLKEQIAERLERFAAQRPPVFNTPGELLPEIAQWVDGFIAGNPAGLIIVGNVGVGKTWTLWKIKEELIRRGSFGAIEIKAAHELKRITTPPVDDDAFTALAEAALLAIDDIGSVRISDWDSDKLLELVDTRWSRQRPTILASNVSKLRTLLEERVASRLGGGAVLVKMTGLDRRRPQ